MAQRRVSATGFGGGTPGVSILSGLAQGKIQKDERESELQRRAILNRLSQAQLQGEKQRQRLAKEDAEFQAKQRERAQRGGEALVTALKDEFPDIPPSVMENMTADQLSELMNFRSTQQGMRASEERIETANLRQRDLQSQIQDRERATRVSELLGSDPTLRFVTTTDTIVDSGGEKGTEGSNTLRQRAIKQRLQSLGVEPDGQLVNDLMEFGRGIRQRKQETASGQGQTGFPAPAEGREKAQRRLIQLQNASPEQLQKKFGASSPVEVITSQMRAQAELASERGSGMTPELQAWIDVAEQAGMDRNTIDAITQGVTQGGG